MPDVSPLQGLVGRRVALPDHFIDAVIIEDARPLGSGADLRVRQANGELDEAVLSPEYLCKNCGSRPHEFRNGLGWAVPATDQVETLRRVHVKKVGDFPLGVLNEH